MKKQLFKTMALALCLTAGMSAFASCGAVERPDSQEEVDVTKTQLNVGVWEGGFRYNWLKEDWAKEFERLHAETVFEEGKKGVQVNVTPSKNYALENVPTVIKGSTDHVIISEQTNTFGFVRENSALDITDILTTPLTEYGETRSIVDKMRETDRAFYGGLKGATSEADYQYVALPWYASFFGINYDVELFEDNNYYFAAEGTGVNGFVTSLDAPKSNGPDGKPNTSDDGLPATFDDFFKLCDKMVQDGVTPMVWTGAVKDYMNYFTASLANDVVGFEQAQLNYTLDGTVADTLVESIDANGNITYMDPVAITNENGYLMQKQEGRYYAFKFLEKLLTTRDEKGNTVYINEADCTSTTGGHMAVQTKFLESRNKSQDNPNVKPIAMLAEGSWWYNEAKPTFDSNASIPGMGMNERRIGFMPMPKPTADYAGEATYTNTWITNIVINANTPASSLAAAKQFVRFIHTDWALSRFTTVANGIRPFDYQLTEEDAANASYFAKQALDIYQNSDIVNPWSSNPLVYNNLASFVGNYDSKAGGSTHTTVVEGLASLAKTSATPALDYFNGLSAYWTESNWNTTFATYLEN
ncbi:MAG: hypothetical protein IJX87_00735 [Clostridia bacterium]|nr:hypothetical protein [Clostridia bacterium]